MGCDLVILIIEFSLLSFNSRTPCGVRPEIRLNNISAQLFQFTHPVWGATTIVINKEESSTFQFTHPVWGATPLPPSPLLRWGRFNSRTPCGVRHKVLMLLSLFLRVSIHAPRVGCDKQNLRTDSVSSQFQFTHPVWGATKYLQYTAHTLKVSIHAPRVGCDCDAQRYALVED